MWKSKKERKPKTIEVVKFYKNNLSWSDMDKPSNIIVYKTQRVNFDNSVTLLAATKSKEAAKETAIFEARNIGWPIVFIDETLEEPKYQVLNLVAKNDRITAYTTEGIVVIVGQEVITNTGSKALQVIVKV